MTTTRMPHARRLPPDPGPTDRRRIVAGVLSGVLPGLGQAVNRRWRLSAIFLGPSLAVLLLAWLLWVTRTPTELAAALIAPTALAAAMLLNVALLVWRAAAVGHAWADRRFTLRPGRTGGIGLVVVLVLVAIPHLVAGYYGYLAWNTFGAVFGGPGGGTTGADDDDPGSTSGPIPQAGERVNVLLLGIDSGPNRTHTLTDTMIVVSLDPVGKSVSMVSIPRDLVDVPLGDGNVFAPKINSLLSYANRHPDQYPQGGTRALEDAIGALLGIPVHYFAKVDLAGFVQMVDAVGGVDVKVANALADPNYGGFGVGPGWSITAGSHHLDGANALAYARIRKSAGESDFTRAARQQQVLVAIRNAAVSRNLLVSLPGLLAAVGDTVRTDIPSSRLPELAALAELIDGTDTVRVVLKSPLVKRGGPSPYGYTLVADPVLIAQMSAVVFPRAGEPAQPWPTPRPTATPAASAAP